MALASYGTTVSQFAGAFRMPGASDSAHLQVQHNRKKLDAGATIAFKLLYTTMPPLLHYYLKKQ